MYNIKRRKFLGLISCGCCSLILPSCSTVPITERKQLSIIPEARINRQAAAAYENFKSKNKLITSGKDIENVINIGKRMEDSVSAFFNSQKKDDPTKNFEWDYILVNNDKVIEINPVQVDRVVDTTGAGDLYAGGFLFGMAKGKDLATCGNYASIAAAEIISHYGARPLVKLSNLI